MTVIFGLASAVVFGLGDFAGGLATRLRGSSVAVLAYTYSVGTLLMLLLAPFFGGALTFRAVVFGTLGGLAGLVGIAVMYTLMAVVPMNVISPVTAVLSAVVPVGFGVIVGERPSSPAWLGIAAGLLAVVLVSRTGEHVRVSLRVLAVAGLSGLGFGVYFICLGYAGPATGLWTLAVARVAGLLVVAVWVTRGGLVQPVFRGRLLLVAVVAGAADSTANLFFVLAAQHGLLGLASVLASLYPAATVALAAVFLHERANRVQQLGLLLALASVALITA